MRLSSSCMGWWSRVVGKSEEGARHLVDVVGMAVLKARVVIECWAGEFVEVAEVGLSNEVMGVAEVWRRW